MSNWRIYEPINRVSAYIDGIASLTDLQVTACVERKTPTPISLAASGCTLSLSLDQSRELRLQLERAERDVRRGPPSCAEEQDDG